MDDGDGTHFFLIRLSRHSYSTSGCDFHNPCHCLPCHVSAPALAATLLFTQLPPHCHWCRSGSSTSSVHQLLRINGPGPATVVIDHIGGLGRCYYVIIFTATSKAGFVTVMLANIFLVKDKAAMSIFINKSMANLDVERINIAENILSRFYRLIAVIR